MVESHDTRVTGLHHADLDAAAQAHFVEPADEVNVSLDFEDTSRFTGPEEMERKDLRHGRRTGR